MPDFSNPVSFKNHNEILRCFSVIGRLMSSVFQFLLIRTPNYNTGQKLCAEIFSLGRRRRFFHLKNEWWSRHGTLLFSRTLYAMIVVST